MFKNEKWVKFSPKKSPENVNQIEKRKHKSRNRQLSKSRNMNREDEEMDGLPDDILVPYVKGLLNLWSFLNDVTKI